MSQWPDPNASRKEIAAFVKANAPPPEPEHEAPAVANGPSVVCNACGVIRVSMSKQFCRGCEAMIGTWV